jgi:hypothetical protein
MDTGIYFDKGREADHSLPPSAEMKAWAYTAIIRRVRKISKSDY